MAQSSLIINYPPHFNALTEGGKHRFARPVDAIAELVDNSIHACRDVPDREITVCVHLDGTLKYLSVLDNGVGMDEQDVQKFATYALSQNARGFTEADLSDSACISKFGVGVKQAGFFLGDRIELLTKTAAQPASLTFAIDKAELQQKHDEQLSNVYSGVVYFGVVPEFTSPSLTALIQRHIAANHHYAIVIIRLYDHVVEEMDLRALAGHLEEIYHFQLHPDHRHPEPMEQPSLEIEYQCHWPHSTGSMTEVNKLSKFAGSEVSKCFALSEKGEYRFQFQIPVSKQCPKDMCTVYGIALYLPCLDGKETNPLLASKVEHEQDCTFKVYWQHRLLPDSKILKLKMFQPKPADFDRIARNWERRVVIFLFFDRQFQDIADSKLRLLVETPWINSKSSNLIGTGTRTTFSEFLKTSYAMDEEHIFCKRDQEKPEQSIFKALKFGSKVISNAQPVLLKWKWKKDPKKGIANKSVAYGRLIDFMADESLRMDVNQYVGRGVFRYVRIPQYRFPSQDIFDAPVDLLDFSNCTMADTKGMRDMDKFESELPHGIEVMIKHKANETPWSTKHIEAMHGEYVELWIKVFDCSRKPVLCLPGYELDTRNGEGCYKAVVSCQDKDDEDEEVHQFRDVEVHQDKGMFLLPWLKFSDTGDFLIMVSVFCGNDLMVSKQFTMRVFSKDAQVLELGKNSLMNGLSLGEPFLPPFEVRLLDSTRHTVAFEGEVFVKLSCQLNNKPLPLKKADQTIELGAGHHGGIGVCAFTEKDWEVDWDAITSTSEEMGSLIHCILQLRFRGETLSLSFTFPLKAGPPAGLCVIDDYDKELSPDDMLEMHVDESMDVRLVCKDICGTKTSPLSSQQWTIALEKDGPFRAPTSQQSTCKVSVDGRAMFKGLRLTNTSLSPLPALQQISWTLSMNAEHTVTLEKVVRVLPSRQPVALQVQLSPLLIDARNHCITQMFYNDGELLGQGPVIDVSLPAGSRLEGPSFKVIGINDSPVDLSSYNHREIRYDWVKVHKPGDSRKRPFQDIDVEENTMDDIELPEEVGVVSHVLEVRVDIFKVLRCELRITVLPLPAEKWCLCVAPDFRTSGLVLGEDMADLAKKLVCIVALDKFNNVAEVDSEPLLSIGIGSKESIEFEHYPLAAAPLKDDVEYFTGDGQVDAVHCSESVTGFGLASNLNWHGGLPVSIDRVCIKVAGTLTGVELIVPAKITPPTVVDDVFEVSVIYVPKPVPVAQPPSVRMEVDDDSDSLDSEDELTPGELAAQKQNKITVSAGVAPAKRSIPMSRPPLLKDIIRCDDPVVNAVLMWHASPYLNTFIVDVAENSAAGLPEGSDVWDLQSLDGLFPLTAPGDASGSHRDESSRLLVDLVTAPPRMERLFQLLFSNAVLCDTLQDAQQYLASLRQQSHNRNVFNSVVAYSKQDKARVTYLGALQYNPLN